MQAPKAEKVATEITQHRKTRVDNYAWLRDENWKSFIEGSLDFQNPKILEYLKAESTYKNVMMADTEKLRTELAKEILTRINEDRESYPYRKKDYLYFQREKKGLNYPVLMRKRVDLDASKNEGKEGVTLESMTTATASKLEGSEEVYFDINKEAEGNALYSLRGHGTSKENSYFAYAFNLTGSLEATIKVRDLKTFQDFQWELPNTSGSFLWLDDTNLLFVEREDDPRGKKIYSLCVTEGLKSKKLVFSKPSEYSAMFMGLTSTTDEAFVGVSLTSGSSSALYLSKKDALVFEPFVTGTNDISYEVEHHDGSFYILTNDFQSPDYKVMKTSSDKNFWPKENWVEYLAHVPGRYVSSISIYHDFMVLQCKNNRLGLPQLMVNPIGSATMGLIEMTEEAYSLSFSGSSDHRDSKPRFHFQSPVSPLKTYELDLFSLETKELHCEKIPNYDPSRYLVKREFATARDGEKIPLTIILPKDFKKDGSGKALVYGYGSYGMGMPATFSSNRFALIDRGFIYCIAHIRGGNDKGETWYLDGKMSKKMNTFQDFIDSCEYLIEAGYTQKERLAINGGSAGGLLMGAVTNLRPDLFRSVIADVPFVDVINTMSDASLPLTPPEWEEWGNPIESEKDFDYMMSYSPYDNVKATHYPAMLFNSGISDEQVTYWEPTKMVAKLRELKTDQNLLLLNLKMHAGHAGASKRYEWIDDLAFNYSFIIKTIT